MMCSHSYPLPLPPLPPHTHIHTHYTLPLPLPTHTTQHQVYKLSGSSVTTDQFQSSLQQFLMQLSEGTLTPSGQWKEQLSTLIHFPPHLPLFSPSPSLFYPPLYPFLSSQLFSPFVYLYILTSQPLIPFHSILLLFLSSIGSLGGTAKVWPPNQPPIPFPSTEDAGVGSFPPRSAIKPEMKMMADQEPMSTTASPHSHTEL